MMLDIAIANWHWLQGAQVHLRDIKIYPLEPRGCHSNETFEEALRGINRHRSSPAQQCSNRAIPLLDHFRLV
jgi:hypothetical protein